LTRTRRKSMGPRIPSIPFIPSIPMASIDRDAPGRLPAPRRYETETSLAASYITEEDENSSRDLPKVGLPKPEVTRRSEFADAPHEKKRKRVPATDPTSSSSIESWPWLERNRGSFLFLSLFSSPLSHVSFRSLLFLLPCPLRTFLTIW
jgi:hypothetical protein